MANSISALRKDYQRGALEREDLLDDPIEQFRLWIEAAIADKLAEPNALVLATADESGRPNARVVLLKAYDHRGFVFYTNYLSKKGHELDSNPYAALVFNWLEHERQVRIRGKIELVSREETQAYFHSRPKGSQVGAWASPQSEVIQDRSILDQKKAELEAKYQHEEVLPVPDQWGGYRLVPDEIEFWQGRSNRLHDRFRFVSTAGNWQIDRLAP